ncbi:hypothetical protein ACH5AI_02050 [Streptomyces collinus]|uniref:hypothetical protein n=1 Tax=Streptomyces collinus TaxID=42684 RepID=UPI00379AA172
MARPSRTRRGSSAGSGHPLTGDHPVAALVELVPDRLNTAELLMAAELEHRSRGIRRYRARLAPSAHAVVLAG